VLIVLLSATSKVSSQGFTTPQLEEIAYKLESRKLLLLDTADYRGKIKALKTINLSVWEINEALNKNILARDSYIEVVEFDVESLRLIVNSKEEEIDQLIKTNVTQKRVGVGLVILSFIGGILIAK
tara:strand:- start:13204 stop:13581 length:378 start_codon:yes stop_codon:yes gene_type:complete